MSYLEPSGGNHETKRVMNTIFSLLLASLGGNIELLTLCSAGAALSYLGHWNGTISAALSNAFGAILDTVHTNLGIGNLIDIWVPLTAAVTLSFVAALVAYPVTLFLGRGKEELVRRAMFMCLVLGNSNNMVLLLMDSLCDTYQPFLKTPKCVTKSTTYATLYILPVTVLTWTFLFPYLLRTPQESETDQLLRPAQHPTSLKNHSFLKSIRGSIFCPPTVTVLIATLLATIPRVAKLLLDENGALHPLLMSTNLVGTIAVPMSSVIVGAELYESLTEAEVKLTFSKTFGSRAILVISLVRFILLPIVGRLLHRLLNLKNYLTPLLEVFVLSEWTVTSANNTIIMASIIAEMMPGRGERLRREVAKCLFVQYLIAPVLVTINTALALRMTFE